jgi:hypothetical protein
LPIFSEIDPGKNVIHSSTINAAKVNPPDRIAAVEAVTERPVSRKIAPRGAFSTPSIMDALREEPRHPEKAAMAETDKDQPAQSDNISPFSQQELLEAWKFFVGRVDAPQLKSALSTREPVLTNKCHIEYELDTDLQFTRLTNELKPKLLEYLRQRFGNQSIEIGFTVTVENGERPKIPYTEAERWDSLVDKYPALATLKSKFGLDFEHS